MARKFCAYFTQLFLGEDKQTVNLGMRWKEYDLWLSKSQICYSLDLFPESILKALCSSVFLFCKVDIIPGPEAHHFGCPVEKIVFPSSSLTTWQPKKIRSSPPSRHASRCLSLYLYFTAFDYMVPSSWIVFSPISMFLNPTSFASPSLNSLAKMKLSPVPSNRGNFSLLCIPATIGGARWHSLVCPFLDSTYLCAAFFLPTRL